LSGGDPWFTSKTEGFNRAAVDCASATHICVVCLQRGTFTPAIPRSKSCRTTDKRTGIRANPDRHRHLLPAQSHGHPMSHGRTLRVLTTRKEIMSAIWLLPKRKLEPAIRSEPRTTTNTLNITSGRCPRTEQRDSAVAHERASRVTCSRISDDRLAVLASPTGPDGITQNAQVNQKSY
jgi:hypothetical protein